jgi:hypothetical protein
MIMKKAYTKPSIYVEPIKLDSPIAANCRADRADMDAVMLFGYFNAEYPCQIVKDSVDWGNSTICYHSSVQMAFLS